MAVKFSLLTFLSASSSVSSISLNKERHIFQTCSFHEESGAVLAFSNETTSLCSIVTYLYSISIKLSTAISRSGCMPYGSTNNALALRIYSSSLFWKVSSAAFVTTKNMRFLASSDNVLKIFLTKSLILLSSILSVPL